MGIMIKKLVKLATFTDALLTQNDNPRKRCWDLNEQSASPSNSSHGLNLRMAGYGYGRGNGLGGNSQGWNTNLAPPAYNYHGQGRGHGGNSGRLGPDSPRQLPREFGRGLRDLSPLE